MAAEIFNYDDTSRVVMAGAKWIKNLSEIIKPADPFFGHQEFIKAEKIFA